MGVIIQPMEERQNLPETNQLSVLISTILLAYAVSPFIKIPDAGINLQLPFGSFSFPINFSTIVSGLFEFLTDFYSMEEDKKPLTGDKLLRAIQSNRRGKAMVRVFLDRVRTGVHPRKIDMKEVYQEAEKTFAGKR